MKGVNDKKKNINIEVYNDKGIKILKVKVKNR